jgi:hypothetical protein
MASALVERHGAGLAVRKEAIVAKVLEQRGGHPGLVHVISAMEACDAYKPWHDKQTHKTYLRPDSGKCLHYYFFFISVFRSCASDCNETPSSTSSWACSICGSPPGLRSACNSTAMAVAGWRGSWQPQAMASPRLTMPLCGSTTGNARELAGAFSPDLLHRVNPCLFASRQCRGAKWRDRYAAHCCPVLDTFGQTCHWSLMPVEYATDLVFRSAGTLGPLYEQLTRQSVMSVKAEQIATFLGRQITPQLTRELGSQFSTRIEGTCIKHRFGDAPIKMYDRFGQILRIKATTNDVAFFKHHRRVASVSMRLAHANETPGEHRQGPPARELAPSRKASTA